MIRNKHLLYTDTHLLPFNRYKMLNAILDEKPKGVFHTGDISNSAQTLFSDLKFLGKRIGRPLYFVLGNHDLHFSDTETVYSTVRALCKEYKNLIWMNDAGVIPLTEEICLVGADGFYDARIGNSDFIKYTFDWFLIKDARVLPTMKDRIELFRNWAKNSANILCTRLEEAVETYKSIILLTHVPPYPEANRSDSWLGEQFWTPYNTNYILGKELEKVMEKHKKRYLTIYCGHTHSAMNIVVSRNIECHVGRGSYYKVSDDEIIYI